MNKMIKTIIMAAFLAIFAFLPVSTQAQVYTNGNSVFLTHYNNGQVLTEGWEIPLVFEVEQSISQYVVAADAIEWEVVTEYVEDRPFKFIKVGYPGRVDSPSFYLHTPLQQASGPLKWLQITPQYQGTVTWLWNGEDVGFGEDYFLLVSEGGVDSNNVLKGVVYFPSGKFGRIRFRITSTLE